MPPRALAKPVKFHLCAKRFHGWTCSTIDVAHFRIFFLNDRVPYKPKLVGMPIILSRKITFLYTWAVGLFIGMQFDFFADVRFRVGVWSSLSEEPQKKLG